MLSNVTHNPMARRNKSKPGKPRYKQRQKRQAKTFQSAETPTSGKAKTSTAGPQQPKVEWVTFEHRDSEGNLTFPQSLIRSTHARRYSEVEDNAEFSALILTTYKPNPLMLIERKIYEVQRLTLDGWRRRGQIHIELEGWRGHEQEWFSAMLGIDVEIANPTPGLPAKGNGYRVTSTSFDKKSVTIHSPDNAHQEVSMYGGTLDITEIWQSAWQRHRAQIGNMALRYVVLPFSVAFGAGTAILWLQTPKDEDPEPSGDTIGETTAEAHTKADASNPLQSDGASSKSAHEARSPREGRPQSSDHGTPHGDPNTTDSGAPPADSPASESRLPVTSEASRKSPTTRADEPPH